MNNQAFSKIWVLIILIIFIVGGVLVWQYFGVPKEETKAPGEVAKETTGDETTDWKTYRNEGYGYEVKYPSYWYYKEEQAFWYENRQKIEIPSVYFGEKSSTGEIIPRVETIFFNSTANLPDNKNNLIFEEWSAVYHNPYFGLYLNPGSELVTIGAENYQGFMKQESTTIGIAIRSNSLFLIHNGNIFNIRGPFVYRTGVPGAWTFDEDYSELENIYNQMLSTFRFLE